MKEFIASKTAIIVGVILAIFIIAFGSFAVGVGVGLRKARFSYAWGQNYERNFIGPRQGMMGGRGFGGGMMRGFDLDIRRFEGRDFKNSFGISGEIISIADNKIIVKDQDEKENAVMVVGGTPIRQFRDSLKIEDLKAGDRIVVMGKPDDSGVIQATLVRVFPKN